MATFDLRVSMTGMGLFATQSATRQLHFLMPSSDSGTSATNQTADCHATADAGASHVHSAVVFVNAAHLQAGSESEIRNAVVPFGIGGRYIDLSTLGGDQTQDPAGQLPDALLDLGRLSDSYVQAGLVSSTPGDRVGSRVTISKGDLECYEPGARWHVTAAEPSIHHMAWLLTWQISGVQTEGDGGFQLEAIEFDSENVFRFPRLFPTKDNNRIHLWVMHLPPDQMPPFGPKPPQPAWGSEPPHLHLAYKLLGPDPKWPVIRYLDNVNDGRGCDPRWPSDRRDSPTPPSPTTTRHPMMPSGGASFGDEWTCMGARAEVR